MWPDERPALLEITEEDAAEYAQQAARVSETRLMSMMDLFMSVDSTLRYASSPRIALESAALKACLRTGEDDTAALIDRIAMLEKQVSDLTEQLKNGVVVAASTQTKAKKPAASAPTVESTPAKPAAQTMPVGNRSSESIWKQMISIVQRKEPSIYSFLTQGKFVGESEDIFRWEGMPIFAKKLNSEAARAAITAALQEASGIPCKFEASAPGMKPVSASESANQFAGELRSIFGGENVLVQND